MANKSAQTRNAPSPRESHVRRSYVSVSGPKQESAKDASFSPFSTSSLSSTIHRCSHSTPRPTERRTFDNNLIWCVKVPALHPGITDMFFFQQYAHTGIVDAYVIHAPQSFEPISSQKNHGVPQNSGLLVFPDITTLNHFMGELSAETFPNTKVEVVYLPSLDRLKTPVGCTHIGCRSLLCILLHSAYHTPTETAKIINGIEDKSHAAQILCHSRFVSPQLATVIHRCPNIRSFVAKEILTTLLSESSAESYIADSMVLFGELHRKGYFPVDPAVTLHSILSEDIVLTAKVSQGLLTFITKLRDFFDGIDMKSVLNMLRMKSHAPDADEAFAEIVKTLSACGDYGVGEIAGFRGASLPSDIRSPTPHNAVLLNMGSELRPILDPDAIGPPSGPASAIALPLTSKHTCVACNGRAKLRCTLCEKHFCAECLKHDVQLHECLARTVYVSKVDPNLSVQELRQIFDKFGTVSKVRLCGDPTQRGMYAFIEFTSVIAAQRMLQMDKQPFREGKEDTWRCLPARQPIHDHNDDDQIASGSKTHPCFFGIPKHLQTVETTTSTRGKVSCKSPVN